jgi:hypothetical protein
MVGAAALLLIGNMLSCNSPTAPDADAPLLLFADAPQSVGPPPTTLHPAVLRWRFAYVNVELLTRSKPGDRIILNFFPGARFEAVCDKLERSIDVGAEDQLIWDGSIGGSRFNWVVLRFHPRERWVNGTTRLQTADMQPFDYIVTPVIVNETRLPGIARLVETDRTRIPPLTDDVVLPDDESGTSSRVRETSAELLSAQLRVRSRGQSFER